MLSPPGHQGVVLSAPSSQRKPQCKNQLWWIPSPEAWSYQAVSPLASFSLTLGERASAPASEAVMGDVMTGREGRSPPANRKCLVNADSFFRISPIAISVWG